MVPPAVAARDELILPSEQRMVRVRDSDGLTRRSTQRDGVRRTFKGLGRGLALYSTMMAVIGGTMSLESEPNQFTRVRFSLTG